MARRKILVVDDDKPILRMLATALEQAGFEVITAEDPGQAMLKVRKEAPALILLDIMMPAGGGLVVADRLRGQWGLKPIPIVAMSASADPGLPEKCRAAGARAFIKKPFNMNQLLETILAALKEPEPGPPSPPPAG